MRRLLLTVVLLHGLLHSLGVAAGLAGMDVAQIPGPVPVSLGVGWLVAGLTVLAAGMSLFAAPRAGWIFGLAGVILSQGMIFTAWPGLHFGTLGNVALLLWSLYELAAHGPWSFRAAYQRDVRRLLATPSDPGVVTEADVARLPEPVQRYVRLTGAVGKPHVGTVRARWRGEIRAGPDAPWMAFTGEQYSSFRPGELPERLFFMDARMKGLPVDVWHRFVGEDATMRVRVLSMIPQVNASGAAMRRAETVTIFNDLCILAPSELTNPAIRWEAVDDRHARATYTRGSETITAELHVNAEGELVDFVSDDRLAITAESATPMRWSTPLRDFRPYGDRHLASAGDGVWHASPRAYPYIRLELLDLAVNPSR